MVGLEVDEALGGFAGGEHFGGEGAAFDFECFEGVFGFAAGDGDGAGRHFGARGGVGVFDLGGGGGFDFAAVEVDVLEERRVEFDGLLGTVLDVDPDGEDAVFDGVGFAEGGLGEGLGVEGVGGDGDGGDGLLFHLGGVGRGKLIFLADSPQQEGGAE